MAEDTISKIERQIRERQAAEEAEAARLKRVAAMKATMSWSPAIGQTICDAIAEGGVLKDICRTLEDVPILKIVRGWIRERPGFAQAVREAEQVRLSSWEDELLIRARDDSKDRIAKDNGFVPDPTAVARSKLQCDTLSRLASLRARASARRASASRRRRSLPLLKASNSAWVGSRRGQRRW